MPSGFEAGSDDGIDAGLLKCRSLFGCGRRANRDDAFRSGTPPGFLVGGIPKMKLNTGTFASINARA